jgi:hypothetical protein
VQVEEGLAAATAVEEPAAPPPPDAAAVAEVRVVTETITPQAALEP